MSVHNGNNGANYLQTMSLNIPCNQTFFVGVWTKRANLDTSVLSRHTHFSTNATLNDQPRVIGQQSATTRDWLVTSTTGQGGSTIVDTWVHLALWFGGWTGTSQEQRSFQNGVSVAHMSGTSNFPSSNLSYLRLLTRWEESPTGNYMRGKIAELAVYTGITVAQRDIILAEMQTTHVGALSITPTYAWRLLDNANATVGGVNLTMVGTVTFDADDHPFATSAPPARRRTFVLM